MLVIFVIPDTGGVVMELAFIVVIQIIITVLHLPNVFGVQIDIGVRIITVLIVIR